MRNTVLSLVIGLCLLLAGFNGSEVFAATKTSLKITITPTLTASPSATLAPTAVPVKENITEPGSKEAAYRLESVLDKQKVGSWNGLNTLKKMVRWAVERGVPANTIVLLLLLPLIATLVSVLHYLIGLSGYGIFMPTMIAVTLVSTGILGGLTLFALILLISIASNLALKKLKLHFWPARSIGLLLISSVTLALMVLSSYIKLVDIRNISIFPVLFMIMLSEEFVRTQLVKSKDEAKRLTVGTIVLAIVGALSMNIRMFQEWILLHPELTILFILIINVVVGNYSGIRLSEVKRFKKAIREK